MLRDIVQYVLCIIEGEGCVQGDTVPREPTFAFGDYGPVAELQLPRSPDQ